MSFLEPWQETSKNAAASLRKGTILRNEANICRFMNNLKFRRGCLLHAGRVLLYSGNQEFSTSRMLRLTNLETPWRRSCCAFVVFFAMSALAVSVATRYCSPQSSSTYSVRTVHKHASPEQSRQRLTKNAANWMPQVPRSSIVYAPTAYPRIAPAGPPLPSLLLETSLYTRPPPCC